MKNKHIDEERKYTNLKVSERVTEGFIPDLKNIKDCDYFYLSPFRRKYTANIALGPKVNFALTEIKRQPKIKKILDIGCGTGWFSLELVRAGYDVTGIDLSDESIRVAIETLKSAQTKENIRNIIYKVGEFLKFDFNGETFDCITCIGVLHHMEDVKPIIKKIKSLLKPKGLLIATDPIEENIQDKEAAIIGLIRIIFSSLGFWYEDLGLFENKTQLEEYFNECKIEYQNWADKRERCGKQSPLNNATSGGSVLEHLKKEFHEINYRPNYCWTPRIIGGIRCISEEMNEKIANILALIDKFFVNKQFLNPYGYMWSGITD